MCTDEKPKEVFSIDGAHPSFAISIIEKDVKTLKQSIRKHGMPWDFVATTVSSGAKFDPWMWAARCGSFQCLEFLAAIAKEHERQIELRHCLPLIENLITAGNDASVQMITTAIARGLEKGSKKTGGFMIPFGSSFFPAATRALFKAFANLPLEKPSSRRGRINLGMRSAFAAILEDDAQAMVASVELCGVEGDDTHRKFFLLAAGGSLWAMRPKCFRHALVQFTRYGLNESGGPKLLETLIDIGPWFDHSAFSSVEGKLFFDELDTALTSCFSMCREEAERALEELSGAPEDAVIERKMLECAQAALANELRSELEEEVALPASPVHAPALAAARL